MSSLSLSILAFQAKPNLVRRSFKGTVSPDIAFYFTVYKFKSVLSVRLLMVYKFVYFEDI
jgi:hypothetical protein